MKRIGLALILFGLLNAALCLTIVYWWVFTNGAPPFVEGHPIEAAAFVPGMIATFTIMFGTFMYLDATR